MSPHDHALWLTLAATTYGGFADVLPGNRTIEKQIVKTLATVAPAIGPWEPVWGPAAHRATPGNVDDAVMVVFRHRSERHRLVVAVRGTNPISVVDWLFGDLWVDTPVRWPFDPTNTAMVSASTALGISLLTNMRSDATDEAADDDGAEPGWFDKLGAAIGTRVRWPFAPRATESPPADVAARIGRLHRAWENRSGDARSDVTELLLKALHEHGPAGNRLVDFLRTAAKQPGLDIVVTGHSKGSALAIALGQWLADTRQGYGDDVVAWDPNLTATLRVYGYAGPTPGNAAFADRVHQTFGDRCVRVANPYDIVTLAWEPESIRRIANLYPADPAPPGLGILADIVARRVAEHGYTHAGTLDPFGEVSPPDRRGFALQVTTQHLDAYLDRFGITTDVATFFGIPGR